METLPFSTTSIATQLHVIRLLNSYELDVRAWEVLLLVANHQGQGLTDLLPLSDISKSALSRYIQLLSGQTRHIRFTAAEHNDSAALPALLEIKPDAVDYRRKQIYLTATAVDLLQQLETAFKR